MGLFKKSRDGHDIDIGEEGGIGNASGKSLETLYEKLFPKIGRDFVSIEDFERIIVEILEHIDPELIEEIDFFSKESAVERAYEYKEFLDKGIDGNKVYADLINMDED